MAQAEMVSPDGLVTYTRWGQRLDSLGNLTDTFVNPNDLIPLQQEQPQAQAQEQPQAAQTPAAQGPVQGTQATQGAAQAQATAQKPYKYWVGPSGKSYVIPTGDMQGVRVIDTPSGQMVEGDPPSAAVAQQMYRAGERTAGSGAGPYQGAFENPLVPMGQWVPRPGGLSNTPGAGYYGDVGRGGDLTKGQGFRTEMKGGTAPAPAQGGQRQTFLPIGGQASASVQKTAQPQDMQPRTAQPAPQPQSAANNLLGAGGPPTNLSGAAADWLNSTAAANPLLRAAGQGMENIGNALAPGWNAFVNAGNQAENAINSALWGPPNPQGSTFDVNSQYPRGYGEPQADWLGTGVTGAGNPYVPPQVPAASAAEFDRSGAAGGATSFGVRPGSASPSFTPAIPGTAGGRGYGVSGQYGDIYPAVGQPGHPGATGTGMAASYPPSFPIDFNTLRSMEAARGLGLVGGQPEWRQGWATQGAPGLYWTGQ